MGHLFLKLVSLICFLFVVKSTCVYLLFFCLVETYGKQCVHTLHIHTYINVRLEMCIYQYIYVFCAFFRLMDDIAISPIDMFKIQFTNQRFRISLIS